MKSMRVRAVSRFVIVLSILAPAMSVKAAELSGTVLMPDGKPAAEAVVYLEGGRTAKPLAHAMVDQRNKTFIPHVSVITRGTTVRFPNSDIVFHNVFAYYQAKRFDLGMYPRGASKSVTFDKPGLVALLCNVHSSMSAYIMVVDTPFCTVADRNGRFTIPSVDDGSYTIKAWQESGDTASNPISVSGQATTTVQLVKQ